MRRSHGQVLFGLALALALGACSPEEGADPLPPLDRFYFPTGVAVSAAPGATGGKALLVASSNFDLRYSATNGGTLLSVNPQTSAVDPIAVPGGAAVDLLDYERIASYAGSVAVVDAATCSNRVALGAGGWTAGAATSGSITITKNKDAGRNRVLVVAIAAVADASTTGAITCTGSYGAQTGFTQVVDSGTAVSNRVKSCIIVLPEAGVAAASTSALSASILVAGATLSGARLQAAFYTDVNQSPIPTATASGASATSTVAYSAAMPSLARGVHIVSIGGLAGATEGTLTPDPPGNTFVRQGVAAFTDASLDTFQRWSGAPESTSLSYTWGGTSPGAAMVGVALAPAALAMVASRFDDVLYRFALGNDGSLSCGPGCVLPLSGAALDPFPITVACGPAGNRAYVGYLDTPRSTSGYGEGAWIAEVELDTDKASDPARIFQIGDGTVRSMAYEKDADRLWIAARSWGARALLYSAVLSDPTWQGFSPSAAMDVVDLYPAVRGLELRSLAVGTPIPGASSRRIYATGRLFDADNIASDGSHPAADVGGLLLVLDVTDGPDGRPAVQVRNTVSLGTSVGDVAVAWRKNAAGTQLRDVVIATALDGDLLFVYDDEAEAIAEVIAHDPISLPYLGDRPMALAVDQQKADATSATYPATVYVGAFGGHRVTRFVLNPADLSLPLVIESIGGLAP